VLAAMSERGGPRTAMSVVPLIMEWSGKSTQCGGLASIAPFTEVT